MLGIWTTRYGGRLVYTLTMLGAAAATFLLSYATTYTQMLIAGLGVGLAGGSFAVGVAYVSPFFPPQKQGTALGIFGAGNVGAAVTKFLAPFVLVSGMQIGMSQQAAAADAIDYLCQPGGLDHGKSGGGKHLLRLDCQLCQSLHLLAQGLAPTVPLLALPELPSAKPLLLAGDFTVPATRSSGFSSRAPPVL